jgi:hypothetical protein
MTDACSASKRFQVQAVSTVSTISPSRTRASRTYGARRNEPRQVSTVDFSTAAPPRAVHSDIAASSDGWTSNAGDSKPSSSRACPSVAPACSIASSGSRTRQLLGRRPDWTISRTASTAAVSVGNVTAVDAVCNGRRVTRSHASTMTPSTPSEPRNSRSGDGPAPLAGTRSDSIGPDGVTTRSASTKSSMRVGPVA